MWPVVSGEQCVLWQRVCHGWGLLGRFAALLQLLAEKQLPAVEQHLYWIQNGDNTTLLLQNLWELCILIKCRHISVHPLEWRPAPGDHLLSFTQNHPFPLLVLCLHAEIIFCISTDSIPHKSNRCSKGNFGKSLFFISQGLWSKQRRLSLQCCV